MGVQAYLRDVRRARRIAKKLLKLHNDKASVIISHKIRITDGREELITEISLLPAGRFYKKTGSEIVEDEELLIEVQEVKDYE